ncbi:MAG: ribbon-helix-helix domain-containing protein [Bifidobacteriaceae bacterium]|jgi:hypothetical protein|nr:ribbon-helix-helix domain-containing protein [Bifidobacteriaceae bacterium]
MRRTNSYFEDRQLAGLDAMARAEGVSRSHVLRRMVDQALAGQDGRLDVDLAAIRGSFGAAPGLVVEPRPDDSRLLRLDAPREADR